MRRLFHWDDEYLMTMHSSKDQGASASSTVAVIYGKPDELKKFVGKWLGATPHAHEAAPDGGWDVWYLGRAVQAPELGDT